jgi:Flp pilus assembly protein TadD
MQAALRDMTRAIELDPFPGAAYGERGIIYLRLGLDAEAEKDFAECRRVQPSLSESLDFRIQTAKSRQVKK